MSRIAGDEFLVLMPDCDDSAAELAATRVIEQLRQPLLLPGVAEPLRIDSSIGIARFPTDAADFDVLVHAADVAMYRSKQLGGGRKGFFLADMDTELRARHTLNANWPRPSNVGSCACTTSRWSSPTVAASSAPRPWCAGRTQAAGC